MKSITLLTAALLFICIPLGLSDVVPNAYARVALLLIAFTGIPALFLVDRRRELRQGHPDPRPFEARIALTPELAAARKHNASLLKRIYVPYLLLGLAIIFIVPEEIGTVFPTAAALLDQVQRWSPGIRHIAAVSPYPEASRMFLIVMLLGLPLIAYRVAVGWKFPPTVMALSPARKLLLIGSALMIGVAVSSFVIFFPETSREHILETGGRGGVFVRWLTQYRLTTALVGSILLCMAGTCIGVALRLAGLSPGQRDRLI